MTNEEFKEQIIDSFEKIKVSPRTYIQVYCVDDVNGRFNVEIGERFDSYINGCHLTVDIHKYHVLNRFESF